MLVPTWSNLLRIVQSYPELSEVVQTTPNLSKLVSPHSQVILARLVNFIIVLVRTVSQVRLNSLFSICNPRQFRLSGQPSQPFETIHPNYASQTRQPSQTRQSALSALKNLAHA